MPAYSLREHRFLKVTALANKVLDAVAVRHATTFLLR